MRAQRVAIYAGSAAAAALRRIASRYSAKARQKRGAIFRQALSPRPGYRILDLGGGDGSYIAHVVHFREGVVVADISADLLRNASTRYGFETLRLEEGGLIPVPDQAFDIVFCSSVIEHVTVDKSDVDKYRTNASFARAALKRQELFANEIRRVGRSYFVQTPSKYFPIESHTWLPGIVVFLPRRIQVRLLGFMNTWWPKKTSPDWHLLTSREMQRLFPDARIVRERSLGMTKSIMAIKQKDALSATSSSGVSYLPEAPVT